MAYDINVPSDKGREEKMIRLKFRLSTEAQRELDDFIAGDLLADEPMLEVAW